MRGDEKFSRKNLVDWAIKCVHMHFVNMLFNSLTFLAFLPLAFAGYWTVDSCLQSHQSLKLWLQNLFVVLISYIFYGWWSWKFLLLISFTSLWAYGSGLLIGPNIVDSERRKNKLIVAAAIFVNLGILCVFKYYDFFAENAVELLKTLGVACPDITLNLILPVGISFYTFQAIGYVIDVYHGRVKATRDVVAFLAFISFFPQLVAGPIERAENLLPQFLRRRKFDYVIAVEGCRQMLWGFFKKLIVAEACGSAVVTTLGNQYATCVFVWMGMILFAIQIYCDFSGYSDIAIGCAKLFGIRLSRNFSNPYFSRDIAEFWRRWHISLTTWFRDYLYITIGGSRCSKIKKVRNTFVIFIASGFWHGANWTFIAWGVFHALCFLPLLLTGRNRKRVSTMVAENSILPSFTEFIQMAITLVLVVVGWAFFRAPDISTAFHWIAVMFGASVTAPIVETATATVGAAAHAPVAEIGVVVGGIWIEKIFSLFIPVCILFIVEWFSRGLAVPRLPQKKFSRWSLYLILAIWFILQYDNPSEFIYFQF